MTKEQKERNRLYAQQYRKDHPEKIKRDNKQYRETHLEKMKKYDKQYREKYREKYWDKNKNRHLKRQHNITIEDYNKLFDQQKGRCGICRKHQSTLSRALCVDHDHKTNRIRGLLCDKCNRAIGIFHDNIGELMASVKYLKKYKDGN